MTTTLLSPSSVNTLTESALGFLQATVLGNPWIPHKPTPKQALFLALPMEEAFYGGAAGGGKSDALLMAALQFAHVPGYAAIVFRRTYPDLALPNALMDRARGWLGGTKAHWNETTKTWAFPSGASLSFGYLEHEQDKFRYQSAEFQFIGFDEVTEFSESQYRFLFSRLRRPLNLDVPLRMRAASNPGGVGHDWVKQRFVDPGDRARPYVRATLADNPHLDRVAYAHSLEQLDPITKAQLLNGDWSVRHGGALFQREWFPIMEQAPADCHWVRYWDLASTEVKPGSDPDWTVGARVGLLGGVYYIQDVRRMQGNPASVEALVRQTAQIDSRRVVVRMEQEPGASGVNTIDHYRRHVLLGYAFDGVRSTGSKVERVRPVSSAAAAGNIRLVSGAWNMVFLDEAEGFPLTGHDDQVDALSGAVAYLSGHGPGSLRGFHV